MENAEKVVIGRGLEALEAWRRAGRLGEEEDPRVLPHPEPADVDGREVLGEVPLPLAAHARLVRCLGPAEGEEAGQVRSYVVLDHERLEREAERLALTYAQARAALWKNGQPLSLGTPSLAEAAAGQVLHQVAVGPSGWPCTRPSTPGTWSSCTGCCGPGPRWRPRRPGGRAPCTTPRRGARPGPRGRC
ncbi:MULTISPECIES: hypothetical protein [Thermaceae]|uniref:hypothetical protein n=1 Tax=Thermaceae TaxID=188786 RepID=UPI000415F296|nr:MULTISPECIES: hypothetical protein [Thermaceae]